jgi:HEAT repeat protein
MVQGAGPQIVEMLKDSDTRVRSAGVQAIGALASQRILMALTTGFARTDVSF